MTLAEEHICCKCCFRQTLPQYLFRWEAALLARCVDV